MQAAADDINNRVPVTIVTGFLGAGKTTLINRILADTAGLRLAIIVNEFGDIGIDGSLIEAGEEELIELSSGCICCVVRGDLIRAMRRLLAEQPGLDGIVIETTGLANPSPVIQTLIVDQLLGAKCRLDSVICLIDAVHISDQLDRWPDASDQIVFSDRLILNKIDDATAPIADIERRLNEINPFARVTRTNHSAMTASDVLGQNSHNLDRIADRLADAPDEIHDHAHHIDASGISSLSLTAQAPIDADAFGHWLQDMLSRYGADILRTKAILSVAGEDRKLVIQAVNMMIEGDFRGPWADKPRLSRIVFIGRKLPHDMLRSGFESCLANQTPRRKDATSCDQYCPR